MSNGHQQAPTSVKDIVSAVFQAGALDQAPQEKPLTVGEIVSSAFNRERQFTPTIEPGVRGFGKGVLKGVVGPTRIFGVDPNLEARQPSGLPAKEATASRIVGEFLGAAAPIVLATHGAGVALGVTGLEAALGPALTRVTADAIGFGLFEAGHAEVMEQLVGEFGKGAAIGAAFGVAHNLLRGRLKGRSVTEDFEISMEGPPKQLGRGPAGFVGSGARATGEARPVPPGGFGAAPKGAGGGPAVSPVQRVIPVESTVVGETVNISPKLYERLLVAAEVGPARAALEAATVSAKGAEVVLSSGAKVQLKRSLETLLSEGAGRLAQPAAKLRGTLGSVVEPRGEPTLRSEMITPGSKQPFYDVTPDDELAILQEEFEMDVTLAPNLLGPDVRGMAFPSVVAGNELQFTRSAILGTDVGILPSGTEVLVRDSPAVGPTAMNMADPLAVPIPLNGAPLRDVTVLDVPKDISFPLGISNDGEYVLSGALNSPASFVRALLDVSAKTSEGEYVIPQILPAGLQVLKNKKGKFDSEPVVLTQEEAKLLRDDLVSLSVRLRNAEPSQYTTEKTINQIAFNLQRKIPSLQASLRAFDPTLEEIVAALQTPLVPAERRLPAQLASLVTGVGGPGRNSLMRPRTTIDIHPDAASLEYEFFQNRNYEDVFAAVGFALNPEDQLAVAAARAAAAFHQGGTSVLSVTEPGPIIRALKKVDPKLRFAVHDPNNGWKSKDLLISHPVVIGPRSLIKQMFVEERYAVLDAVLHDQAPAIQLQNLLTILRAPLEGEISSDVTIIGGYAVDELGRGWFGGGAYGTYGFDQPTFKSHYARVEPIIDPNNPQLPGARIRYAVDSEAPPDQQFGTLIHEYTHHLFAAIANRLGMDAKVVSDIIARNDTALADAGITDFFGTFRQVVDHWTPTDAEFQRVFGSRMPPTGEPPLLNTGKGSYPKMSEVLEAAVQVRARTGAEMFTPVKRGSDAWVKAFNDVVTDIPNFRTDTELAARLVELMAIDMEAAKELAPTATKIMSEVIHEFSPRLTLGLAGHPIVRVQDLVDEKSVLGFVRALTPVEKWSRDVTVLSEAKLNQFKREGIFDGMSVEVWGTEYIAERRIPTAGVYTKRDKVILRDPYTGSKFTTEWDYVRRSSDPSGALKDFPKMLDEFETELPTSVGLVVEDIESGVAWRHYHDLISTDDKALLFDGYEDALEYLISKNPELAEVTIGPEGILNLLAKAASRLGGKGKLERRSPGMVLRDKGAYKLILPDPLEPPREGSIGTPREEFRPRGSFDRVNAKVGDQVIDIDIETIAEGFMAGQVNDRDLPYFVSALARRARSRDLAGLEPGIFNHWKLARKSEPASPPTGPLGGPLAEALKKLEEVTKQLSGELGFTVESRVLEGGLHTRSLNSAAARKGARRRTTTQGQERIDLDAADARRRAGVFETADDYHEYLRQVHTRRQKMGGLGEESRAAGDAFDSLGSREKVGRNGADGEPPPPGGDGVGGPKSGEYGGGAGLGGGGGSRPPRFGETMDGQSPPSAKWYEKVADSLQFFGAMITAMENTSKVIERNFNLPAYTRVFQPLQKGIRRVDLEMKAPRPALDGKSYHDQLKTLEKMLWQVRRKEARANVVRWMEAMSKQEVAAAGGLMRRGMNQVELDMSRAISSMGLQDDMPYLISTWRMMSNVMRGRKEFGRQYKQMIGQDLSPRVLENLEKLRVASKRKKSWEFDEVAAFLNLSRGEQDIIKMLELTKKFSKDKFSIYAVSRHAAARELPAGYKTMRDAVAAELKLSPLQLKIGAEMEKLFNATFPTIGIDSKRYLGGYYPHLRAYMEEGIMPDAPYIKDIFPKASNFTANKFRSGELDPYTMEPLKVAYKHVRGILMHQHFDPHMKDVRNVLQQLYAKDRRSFRLMNEYVRELQGKPHQSFTDLQKAIEGTAKIAGVDVDREFSRTVINSIAGLTYSATIPFRAALIARNYFQMVQMIAPRVGMQDFVAGLKIAMTKEGYAMAKKAGAITENVAPIMSQEAMFNFTNLRLNQRLQRLTEIGFRWYQKADDMGRGAAFHAQRVRTGRAIDNLMKGKYGNPRSAQAKLKMLEDGKVLTFDPLDQAKFIELFDAGKFEAAKNSLGEMLARETIFRYGHANHPSGWGSVYGRLFGQFGTWPVQYKDFLLQGVTRGTAKDKFQFLATHGAINYGIIRAGVALGYDLESWVSYPSLQYTGGPWSDIAIDMVKMLGGSEMERKMAFKSLQFQFAPTLSDPRAIWLPTSYAVNDALKVFSSPPRVDEALGFRRIEHDIDTSAILGL